jgi:hypothetical protein
VFEGYGVGLTVAPLGLGDPGRVGPPGVVVRPWRLCEVLPVREWSDAEKALELSRIGALEAVLAAYKAFVVMGLAADRPDAGTRRRVCLRAGRPHRLRQPVLPVPPAPPAEDPRLRLAVRPHPRRPAPGDHSQR